jgi:flavin-dependent dehydrogenase
MMPTTRSISDAAVETCDVFIIGGGPAGSTVAALLAQRGLDVVLAEKERHPRFHIGESLLPMNLELFDRLGVSDQIEAIAIHKPGVELNSPLHDQPVTLNFSEAWDKTRSYSYQVRRSEFDQILFENCVAQGTRAMQACRVTATAFPAKGGVSITTDSNDDGERTWQARYLVDASGRDTFLANRLSIKRRNQHHISAALFGHFAGAQRLPGTAEGNISLFWFEHGWFWFIPLLDGTTSVGAVCTPEYLRTRKTDPNSFLLDTIALCPALAKRLVDASLVNDATATGNYSYQSQRMTGDRYILLGDAYAFVDPVFSSGVMLAMQSAFLGADVVEACLRNPARAVAQKQYFEKSVRHGLQHFSWFIYRMTRPAMVALFMAPSNRFRIQEAILALLSGDLYRGTPIYRSLFAFKVIYYVTSAFRFKQTFRAWRTSRKSLRVLKVERAA